jgi:hypothetical protein
MKISENFEATQKAKFQLKDSGVCMSAENAVLKNITWEFHCTVYIFKQPFRYTL